MGLTEIPSTKIIMVDQKQAPGGHWVDSYGYVHLHQPSVLYGVASRQLEGNWLKVFLLKRKFPWNHRASKKEILTYFNDFVKDKVANGQLEYYPSCKYDFGQEVSDNIHSFSTLDGKKIYSVEVQTKLVNGVIGECLIPSQCPVQFPIDKGINLLTPNELFDSHIAKRPLAKNYIVLGAGKTAMDAIVYLQKNMNVNPKHVSWVISNDVWMLAREGSGGPWVWPQALLQHDGDFDRAAFALEEAGGFVRVDKKVVPTAFKFPVVGKDELKLLRMIQNKVRRGRVTAISLHEGSASLEFGTDQDPWLTSKDSVFIHCTSPGPFNGREYMDVFISDKEMTLPLLFAPPVSLSMSCMGFLESARSKGKLDIDFGIKLIEAKNVKQMESPQHTILEENEVLRLLIEEVELLLDDTANQFNSIFNLALFLCLADHDPFVGYNWLKDNRLSFLSIPGFKCKIYENIKSLVTDGKSLGISEGKLRMFELLRDKLECLEGK